MALFHFAIYKVSFLKEGSVSHMKTELWKCEQGFLNVVNVQTHYLPFRSNNAFNFVLQTKDRKYILLLLHPWQQHASGKDKVVRVNQIINNLRWITGYLTAGELLSFPLCQSSVFHSASHNTVTRPAARVMSGS